jgi:hypothetical protein
MKRIIIIGICLLFITNLFGRSIIDSLSIYNKIEKANIIKIELRKGYTKDSEFVISDGIKSSINGICVTGTGTLYSDTSLIRIIAIDINDNEYLMCESTVLSDEIGKKVEFSNRSDETFLLEPFSLQKVIIQLINAEVEINDLTYYNCIEKDKHKRELLRDNLKKEIVDKKLKIVQSYIKKNKMIWAAYNNSHATSAYSSKKKVYGEKYNTFGLEYYQDGFFKLPPSFSLDKVKLKSATTTSFVSEFDWRNRHGQNWLTPNKCQSGCWINNTINCNFDATACTNAGGVYRSAGTCWAFGPIAAVEALTNLYFNQHIDYDLSEQQLVSCCTTFANLTGYQTDALDYIQNHGAVPESCYPCIALKGSCNSVCSNPQDRVSFLSYSYKYSENDLKKSLIAKGPMACDMGAGWSHTNLYVGFGTVKVGDYIDFTGGNTVQPGDTNIGKTYWILKDNNTYTGWPYHAGFIYMLDKPDYANPIDMPITSQIYSTNNIICSDNDHDGYYWWGIGPKPAACPLCSSNQEDGDDSNPNLGPMDEYGNCTIISSPYAFPDHQITSTETWQNTQTECGNVIVKNGGNLSINGATVNLEGYATFSVEVGGTLIFNSGTIQ